MADDDLDELLVILEAQLDANLKTRLVAAENAEHARQAFLQRFRDVAESDILPVFHHVAARSNEALKIKVINSAEAVVLSITMRGDFPLLSGSLGYQAEPESRRVLKARRIEGRDMGRALPAHEGELTSEPIKREIAELLREMMSTLERRRPS